MRRAAADFANTTGVEAIHRVRNVNPSDVDTALANVANYVLTRNLVEVGDCDDR
jgi:hypothetical protein